MTRIFLIDDNELISKIYRTHLEKEGFSVSVAGSGDEGLRRIGEEHPDLVVLDLILPGINGFEILRRLKEDISTKDIPVIILTVLEQPEDIARGMGLGAQTYLSKSETDAADLANKVREALAKKTE